MTELVLVVVFVVCSIVGYYLIKNVPSLLHTPLMSGMNALSGIAILGALSATGMAIITSNKVFGYIAIVLAMINVAGGFSVTSRMLKMFNREEK